MEICTEQSPPTSLITSPLPADLSESDLPSERTLFLESVTLENAYSMSGFRERHPYIRWPNFGHNIAPRGEMSVWFEVLAEHALPKAFIASCKDRGYRPLLVQELLELVGRSPNDLEKFHIFALEEHYKVAGFPGYAHATHKEGGWSLGCWYFAEKWPENSIVPIRSI